MKNINGIMVIDLDSIRSPKFESNIETFGDHSNTCHVCGKRTASNQFIHITTDDFLVPIDLDESTIELHGLESNGCFPVGSECAKKIDKNFIYKF